MVIRENRMCYYDRTMKEEAVMRDLTRGVIVGVLSVFAVKAIYNKGYNDALSMANRELQKVLDEVKSKVEEMKNEGES